VAISKRIMRGTMRFWLRGRQAACARSCVWREGKEVVQVRPISRREGEVGRGEGRPGEAALWGEYGGASA
jgi:hypothetical protein